MNLDSHRLCRALSGHAWTITPPIVILDNDDRRIKLRCGRCGSSRTDTWSLKDGSVRARYYDLAEEYTSFLQEATRADARVLTLKELKDHATKDDSVRPTQRRRSQIRSGNVRRKQWKRQARRKA